MAELAGASTLSPQRALLDLVAEADVLLLLVGHRYSPPTEDEFDEARRLGKDILVLRQSGPLDSEQEAFLERVAGGWKGGRLWGSFESATDVGLAVVKALSGLSGDAAAAQLRPQAEERARALAMGNAGWNASQGSIGRVAFVPLIAGHLEPLRVSCRLFGLSLGLLA